MNDSEANEIMIGVIKVLFFFKSKKNRLFSKLTKAFPKEYTVDIEAVCNALSATSMAFNGALYSDETTEWRLPSGENISIPYRIYISDKLFFPNKLTERQILIYHCIFSRSYDGYIRQKHIEALLDANTPEWAMAVYRKDLRRVCICNSGNCLSKTAR